MAQQSQQVVRVTVMLDFRETNPVHTCDKRHAYRARGNLWPRLNIHSVHDEDQALQMANDVNYGLTGYIWTNDLTRALRFSDKLEAGMIWVNSENVRHPPTPLVVLRPVALVVMAAIGRLSFIWNKSISDLRRGRYYPKIRKTVMPVPAPI